MADGEEEKKIIFAGEEEKQIVYFGAGDASEEKKVGEGGERNENMNWTGDELLVPPPPPGFRFTPREDELVRYYLLPKLQGREHVPNDAIIEDNVYQCHPDQLTEKYRDRGDESWHFLTPRERKYRNGDRPSRSTDDSRGRWKASTGTKVVVISVDGSEDGSGSKTTKSKAAQLGAGDGMIKYKESTLSYYEGPIRNEIKSRWLMKELTIPEYENKRGKNGAGSGGVDGNMLNQYVMCKIYVTPRRRGDGDGDEDEDEAGPSWTQPDPEECGQGTTAAGCEKLSEKQAGKRPAKDQSAGGAPKRAHHHNPDRLHLGPPAPLHGHGMQAPFRAPGYYGGGPGRPMGYYARPPMMPRPPIMMYNNGQVHVPRQQAGYNGGQVAYNGQVPVSRQQVAYNGQVPLQQVAYNGQVPMPRQQVPYSGQVVRPPVLKLSPPYRPAGAPGSSGQNQTMMKRPPCPAGQAVKNPPSSVVPRPAQMQKQPETYEMRENRVLRQHMEEYSRITQSSTPRPPASAAHVAQQQQRRPTAFTQQQQYQKQQQPTTFTHQQQQQPTAFTQQQQYRQQRRRPTAFTQQQQYQQQQQQPTAFTHQQQYQQQQQQRTMIAHHHQQRPYFGGNANYHHHAGPMAPQLSVDNLYASEAAQHYQCTKVIPATSGCAGASMAPAEGLVSSVVSGAGNEVSGANRDCSNDDEIEFVESATVGGSASAADGDGPKYESAQ